MILLQIAYWIFILAALAVAIRFISLGMALAIVYAIDKYHDRRR